MEVQEKYQNVAVINLSKTFLSQREKVAYEFHFCQALYYLYKNLFADNRKLSRYLSYLFKMPKNLSRYRQDIYLISKVSAISDNLSKKYLLIKLSR